MERVKLSERQIEERLSSLSGWKIDAGKLAKTFEFPAYASGLAFASAVGHVADRMDHHPDLTIGYRKVNVAVNTHDVGGISEWDFELARRVDALG